MGEDQRRRTERGGEFEAMSMQPALRQMPGEPGQADAGNAR